MVEIPLLSQLTMTILYFIDAAIINRVDQKGGPCLDIASHHFFRVNLRHACIFHILSDRCVLPDGVLHGPKTCDVESIFLNR